MWRILDRCKNCKYLHYVWGDSSRCRCAITWQKIYLKDHLEGIFCIYFKDKKEKGDHIDL
jgi:hypothetical protein